MWAFKSICFCLAFMLVSAPAGAGTPNPSLRYRVVDVAAGDRLNVREQPGVKADVIGGLAPHADSIVITGSVIKVDGSEWWEIIFVEGYLSRGWVSGRFLEPADLTEGERDYPLTCVGTEPFWSLELANGQAIYSSPSEDGLSMSAGPWMRARGLRGRFVVELEQDGQTGYASIWRERDFCSDGMSDMRYPFGTILIRPDGEVLAGCCRRSGE